MVLNEDQLRSKEIIISSFLSGRREYCLQGYAGTGKTTLAQFIAQEMLSKGLIYHVRVLTPTHKALRVISRNFSMVPGAVFQTIHSLVGFRIDKQNSTPDNKKFVVMKSMENIMLSTAALVVVDECSMIDELLYRELITLLKTYEEYYDAKIYLLFMGDPLQVPPVSRRKHELSPTFRYPDCTTLRRIVRQSDDSDVKRLAQHVRDYDEKKGEGFMHYLASYLNERELKEVVVLPYSIEYVVQLYLYDWKKAEEEIFERTHDYQKFIGNKRKMDNVNREIYRHIDKLMYRSRVIAYDNKNVNYINLTIKQHLFDEESCVNGFCSGELVMANRNFYDDFFINGADYFVSYVNKLNYNIKLMNEQLDVKEYQTISSQSNTDVFNRFRYLHEELKNNKQSKKYDKQLQEQLMDRIMEIEKEYLLLEDIYSMKGVLLREADIKPAYAITIHKAQGSTYRNAYVLLDTIIDRRNEHYQRQLFYTAITRPSNLLFLFTQWVH